VDEFTNGVHENHNILLEKFSHFSELMNIAETKDRAFLFATDKRINVSFSKDALANNLSPSTSKN
jgi:hypothetical protein